MDIEKKNRRELIAGLEPSFNCFEEVRLQNPQFPNFEIIADVVAIPYDPDFRFYAFAFEVKAPQKPLSDALWCRTIKQTSDYIFGKIVPQNRQEITKFLGRRIAASFIYPSPILPQVGIGADRKYPAGLVKEGDEDFVWGAFLLGMNFRVGHAYWEKRYNHENLNLNIGPADIWNSAKGFLPKANDLVRRKRPFGSKNVDLLSELDGIGPHINC